MADSSRRYSYLEHLSVDRLEELLDLAVNADEEENTEYVDAILEVIVRKEKEKPTGRLTNVDKAWADFQTYYNTEDGRGQTLHFTEESENSADTMPTRHGTLRKMWKTALLAATIALCLLFSIVAAQAAGFDVLGALARWTDDIFTFGSIQPETVDIPSSEEKNASANESAKSVTTLKTSQPLSYSSLQDALDEYSITEISEPTNLPEGYELDRIRGGNLQRFTLDARYTNGKDFLTISIVSHNDNPNMQTEKTDTPVEVFNVNDTDCYLLRNTNNYTVTWLTEHYECFVFAPPEMEKNVLKDITLNILK